jgi:hypothetical protein
MKNKTAWADVRNINIKNAAEMVELSGVSRQMLNYNKRKNPELYQQQIADLFLDKIIALLGDFEC